MFGHKTIITVFILSLVYLQPVFSAVIWPTNSSWTAIVYNSGNLPDPDNEFTGASGLSYLDIEGDATYAAGFYSLYDGGTSTLGDDVLMFRMRLDGNSQTATYQFSFDTNNTPTTLDWVLQYDDVGDSAVELIPSTVTGPTYGAVKLSTTNVWSGDFATYARTFVPTGDGSNFGGNPDFFIDVAIPWMSWQDATGLTQASAFRVALSTATQHNVLNKDLPQALGSGSLVNSGFSDPIELKDISEIPEPGTFTLMGFALGVMYLRCRKSRAK